MRAEGHVYVQENNDSWVLDTLQPPIIVRTIVNKSEEDSENAAFVDRHLNGPNIIKQEYEVQIDPVKLRIVQDGI